MKKRGMVMNIQWFPGHMTKTRRLISENIKLVDIVIELADARLPRSSRNPEIDGIVGVRPRILVLNKCDMSDQYANNLWLEHFKIQGIPVILADSSSGYGLNRLTPEIDKVLLEKRERDSAKGIVKRTVRMMVAGIPNVGKSSFINKLSGRAAAKTGDRPGVTTAKQWIKLPGKYEMLDTPGVLWPKFEDEEIALNIAFSGGIKDEILDTEEICCRLLEFLWDKYPRNLCDRYKIEDEIDIKKMQGFEILTIIAKKRGCVVSGGGFDTLRAASIVLDEFRAAKIGKITLELP